MSYKLLTTHTHSSKFTGFELKHYFLLTGLSTSAICILRHKSIRGHLPFYRLKVQKPGKQSIERKSSFPSTKTSSEPWKTINRKNVFLSIDKKFKNLENNQSKECLPFHRRKSSKTWKTINRKNVFLSIDETVQKPGKQSIERMSSFLSTKKFKNLENNQSKECLPFYRLKVQKPGKQSIERKSSFPSTKTSSEPWKTINRKNVFLSIDKKFKNLENNQSKECLPFHRRKSSKTWKTINRKNVFLSIDETVQKPGKQSIERMSSFPSTKKFKNLENNQSKECLPFHRRNSSTQRAYDFPATANTFYFPTTKLQLICRCARRRYPRACLYARE